MRILLNIALTTTLALALAPPTAHAYLAYFVNGRTMEVVSHRVDGGKVYLKLSSGEAEFDISQIDLDKTTSDRDSHLKALEKARALMEADDAPAAADIYAGMIGPSCEDVELMELSGAALMAAGRYDDAAETYKRIQEMEPDRPGTRRTLGEIFYGQGAYYEAIDQFLLALDDDPDDKAAHLGLGMCYARQEMYEGAKTELNKAVELYPKYAAAYAALGYVNYKKSEFEVAEGMLKMSVSLDDSLPEAHYYTGLLYGVMSYESHDSKERLELNDKSIEAFRKAVTLRKFYPEAHADLGVAYYNRGSVARAVEEFNIALTQKPDMAVTHSNLAGIYNHRGFYEEAVIEAEKAVAIDPRLVEAYMVMGNACTNMRKYKEAAMAYDRYLYYSPSGPLADEAAERLKWVIQESGIAWPPTDEDGGV